MTQDDTNENNDAVTVYLSLTNDQIKQLTNITREFHKLNTLSRRISKQAD